jgi:hypothetical protein
MKYELRNGIEAARDSLEQGLGEVKKGVEQAQQSLNTTTGNESRSKNKRNTRDTTTVYHPATPTETVYWTVEVKDKERRQKTQEVENLLKLKAAQSVNQWVTERMPLKNIFLNVVTVPWLQERGVFSDPIEFETEDVPRINSSETDPLSGGTLKVSLLPAVQVSLLEMGYLQLESIMRNEQFQAQWIISIVLFGITVFVGILGLVKTLVLRRESAFQGQPVT